MGVIRREVCEGVQYCVLIGFKLTCHSDIVTINQRIDPDIDLILLVRRIFSRKSYPSFQFLNVRSTNSREFVSLVVTLLSLNQIGICSTSSYIDLLLSSKIVSHIFYASSGGPPSCQSVLSKKLNTSGSAPVLRTISFVLPSNHSPSRVVARERATYACPFSNILERSALTKSRVIPCDRWIVTVEFIHQ